MAYIVNITQQHINSGYKLRSKRCPVALAIADATKIQLGNIAVTYSHIAFQGYLFSAQTTKTLSHWIMSFDWGNSVLPISFILTLGDPIEDSPKIEML